MDALYKKESNASYLILEKPKDASSFLINMLLENQIPGLLSFEKRSFNGEESFYYDISGKISLENLIKMRLLKAKDIIALLEKLLFTVQTCSSYFLDIEGLLLDFAFIYESDTEYYFCYYPALQEEIEEKLMVFAENLISCVDHEDDQAVAYVYHFYRLVKENTLTIVQILQELFEKTEKKEKIDSDNVTVLEDRTEKEEFFERDELSWWEERPADGEKDINEGSKGQGTDWLTLTIFLLLAIGSVFYFIYGYKSMESFSLSMVLSCREGILATVFLLLSIPGMFLAIFGDKIYRALFRK